MRPFKKIGIGLIDDELKRLINTTNKIIPVEESYITANTNPQNYEYVICVTNASELKNNIYRWNSTVWELVGADDRDISWSDVKGKPNVSTKEELNDVEASLGWKMDSSYLQTEQKDAQGNYVMIDDAQPGFLHDTVTNGESMQRLGKNYFNKEAQPYMMHGVTYEKLPTGIKVRATEIGGVDAIEYRVKVKPNTKYTLSADIVNISGDGGTKRIANKDGSGASVSKNDIIITSNSDTLVIHLYVDIGNTQTIVAECEFNNIMLNEGVKIPFESYTNHPFISPDTPIPFESVADANADGLHKLEHVSCGKNLLDISSMRLSNNVEVIGETSEYIDVKYKSGANNTSHVAFEIKPPHNKNLTMSAGIRYIILSNNNTVIVGDSPPLCITIFSQSELKYISAHIGLDDMTVNKVVEKNIQSWFPLDYYFKDFNTMLLRLQTSTGVSNLNGDIVVRVYKDIMVNMDTILPYEPYQGNTITTQLSDSLRSLPNGVCDKHYAEQGIVERNTKVVMVRDHTIGVGKDYTNVDYLVVQPPNKHNSYADNSFLCTNGKVSRPYDDVSNIGKLYANPPNFVLIIPKGMTKEQALQTYGDVEIMYQLATPTIEQVSPFYIPVRDGINNIFTTDKLQPDMSIKYPKTLPAILEESHKKAKVELDYELGSDYCRAIHKDAIGEYINIGDSQDGYVKDTVIDGKSRQVLNGVDFIKSGADKYTYWLGYKGKENISIATSSTTKTSTATIIGNGYSNPILYKYFYTNYQNNNTLLYASSIIDNGVEFDVTIPLSNEVPVTIQVSFTEGDTGESAVGLLSKSISINDISPTSRNINLKFVSTVALSKPYARFAVIIMPNISTTTTDDIGKAVTIGECVTIANNITKPSPNLPIPIESVADADEQGVHKIEISSTGKNLVDSSKLNISAGYYYDSTGLPNDAIGMFAKLNEFDCFLLKGEVYKYLTSLPTYSAWGVTKLNKLVRIDIDKANKLLKPNEDFIKIRLSFHDGIKTSQQLVDGFDHFQITKGTAVIPYTPYRGKTNTTQLTAPLRSLPSGVCDKYYPERGEVVRNVVEQVLDGSADEEWKIYGGSGAIPDRFYVPRSSCPDMNVIGNDKKGNVSCDRYKNITYNDQFKSRDYGISTYNNIAPDFVFFINRRDTMNLQQFIDDLKANPITIIYETLTPTIESVPKSYIPTYEPITNIYTTDKLQPKIRFTYPLSILSICNRIEVLENLIIKSVAQQDVMNFKLGGR